MSVTLPPGLTVVHKFYSAIKFESIKEQKRVLSKHCYVFPSEYEPGGKIPIFGASDLFRYKPICTATED